MDDSPRTPPDPAPTAPAAPEPVPIDLPLADELEPAEDSGGLTSPGSPGPRAPLRVAAKPADRVPPSPMRVLATVAALFVVAFLFLRTFAVEPFGVPTGSMAPTLVGNHREAPCPRCGYPVRVGTPSTGEPPGYFADVPCPNCGKRVNLTQAPDVSGDRLLVDKNVYLLRRPRRWEVAVFHCRSDSRKPYVKRVVGLPGEVLVIDDGDVYVIPDPRQPQRRELLRKGIAEAREARVLVFDLGYGPNPGGWGPRWLVYPPEQDPRLPRDPSVRPPAPADGSVLADGVLTLDASAGPQAEVRLEYRHWNLDEGREEAVKSWNAYDGHTRSASSVYPVHDFFLACEVEVAAVTGEGVFACRLFDGSDSVTAEVAAGPRESGRVHLTHDGKGGLASAAGFALEPGRTYKVEFALVDRRASLAVDGKPVVAPADLPAAPKRGEVRRPLQLGARGCKLVVRNLRLYRDIHYTQAGRHGTTRGPARLGPTEYFLLGDNSANSQDSREWPTPGVPEAEFIGKPFLIHQPLRLGRVTVGGRERVFQTLDWSRLRLLH